MTTMVTDKVMTPSMSSQVNIALDQLDKHKLKEAEKSLQQILQEVQPSTKDRDKHVVRALVALGDISYKQARQARGSFLEWHWRYLETLAFYYRAIKHCEESLKSDTFDNKLRQWLQQERTRILATCALVEDTLVRSIQKHLLGRSSEMKHSKAIPLDRVINTQWLESLHKYCRDHKKQKVDNLTDTSSDTESEKESLVEDIKEKEKEEKMEKEAELEKKSKVKFDKIQKAVQKLARQISNEVRYRQKMGLSPSNIEHVIDINKIQEDSDDDTEVFTEASEPEVEKRTTPERSASKKTLKPRSSQPEYNWTEDRFDSVVKYTVRGDRETLPFSPAKYAKQEVSSKPLLEHKRTRSVGDRLPVVLTIWEAYHQPLPSTDLFLQVAPHRLETFEELSPITEVFHFPGEGSKTEQKGFFSDPVTDDTVIFAFARVLCSMAKKWCEETRVLAANEVFKFAVGLYQKVSTEEAVEKYLAEALMYLGSIKCQLGDIIGGTRLMEQSIKLYEEINEADSASRIARVWFEMGNAYIAGQLDNGALYDLMMKSVREGLENEFKKTEGDMNDDEAYDSDSEEDEEDTKSEGESYFLGIHEAMDCYTEAVSILAEIPKNDSETNLFGEVQTKLGDCYIMAGNYDKAVTYYEEAMKVHKRSLGAKSLPNNAHALLMMGMTNYVLGNHPKAVRMFETAQLIQQHIHGMDSASFAMAFNFTMMGISNFLMQQYHKCIVSCLKAFEMYMNIYRNSMTAAEEQKLWFITNTLYYLGYSYSTLNLHDKSLHYLELCRYLITKSENKNIKQLVKTLKAMADVHTARDESERALELYNEAYEYSMSIGDESSATTLQNQLLNRMAGVHVSTKQYNEAAEYLEQALDHQKNLETDIKGDLITILYQLGITYTLAGDLDKAIDCFNECLESYHEINTSPDEGLAQTLCSLATLYHVKGCMQEDSEDITYYEELSDEYFQQAWKIEPRGVIAVKYASYLYQQAMYADALEVLLPMLSVSYTPEQKEVCYRGVEQAILPEQLQTEVDDVDEALLNLKIYANFLAVLCFRQIGLTKDAEDCMMHIFYMAMPTRTAINMSMLAFSMLELNLYIEAACTFYDAAALYEDQTLPLTNMKLCIMTWIYSIYAKAIEEYYCYCLSFVIKEELRKAQEASHRRKLETPELGDGNPREVSPQRSPVTKAPRDSGYFGNRIEDNVDRYRAKLDSDLTERESWVTSTETETSSTETIRTPKALLAALRKKWASSETIASDKGYTSTETLVSSESQDDMLRHLEKQGTPREVIQAAWSAHRMDMRATMASESTENLHRFASVSTLQDRSYESQQNLHDEETWLTYEETVDTPAVILQSGSMQDLRGIGQEVDTQQHTGLSASMSMGELRFSGGLSEVSEEIPIDTTPDEQEEWTTVTETVETPHAILHSMKPDNDNQTSVKQSEYLSSTDNYKGQTAAYSTSETQSMPTSPSDAPKTRSVVQETLATYRAKYGIGGGKHSTPSPTPAEDTPSKEDKMSPARETDYRVRYTSTPIKSPEEDHRIHYTSTPVKTPEDDYSNYTWQSTEETVETPIELLEILAKQGLRAAEEAYSALAPEEQEKIMESVSEVNEPWTTVEEEVVETPQAVLDLLRSGSVSSSDNEISPGRQSYGSSGSESHKYNGISASDTLNTRTGYNESGGSQYESYSSKSYHGHKDQNHFSRNRFSPEHTEEVSSPTRFSSSSYQSPHGDALHQVNTEEVWTTEETVTTPREIIDMIKKQNQTNDNTDPTLKFRFSSSSDRENFTAEDTTNINSQSYRDYSVDNNKYGRYDSQQSGMTVETMNQTNQRHMDRGDSQEIWESSEETVETPAAILQVLRAAQQMH